MLLRKRIWDILREGAPKVRAEATLSEVMVVLHMYQKDDPMCPAVVVVDERDKPVGVVTMRGILEYIRDTMRSREILRSFEAANFEDVMNQSCDTFGSTPLDGIMEKGALIVHPEEPILFLMRDFLKKEIDLAVVVDGEKLLGLVTLSDLYREISLTMVHECHFN